MRPIEMYFDVRMFTGYLQKVTHHEFFTLYVAIADRLEAEQEEFDEYIGLCVNNYLRHRKVVDDLNAMSVAHNLTSLIDGLVSRSHNLLLGIRRAVDALAEMPDARNQQLTHLLQGWMRSVRYNMTARTHARQIEAVAALRHGAEQDEAVTDALAALGLDKVFARVCDMHTQIAQMRDIRNSDNALARLRRDGFRRQVVFDMQILLEGLRGMASLEGESRDRYRLLCIDLSNLLVSSRGTYDGRLSRKENEKMNSTSDDETDDSFPDTEGGSPDNDGDDESDSDHQDYEDDEL